MPFMESELPPPSSSMNVLIPALWLGTMSIVSALFTLIVLGRKGPHGFPFRRPHSHFPIH